MTIKVQCQKEKILDKEWDVLIILDACRFDLFQRVNFIDGVLSAVKSPASESAGWIKHTFLEPASSDTEGAIAIKHDDIISYFTPVDFGETVLTSGNAFVNRVKDQLKLRYLYEGYRHDWIDDPHTISPISLSQAFLKNIESYPDSKHIVWYMQPHLPILNGYDKKHPCYIESDKGHSIIWELAKRGKVSPEYLTRCFEDNLSIVMWIIKDMVLPHIKDRRVVITSDHGEFFGEDNSYGHPSGRDSPILRHVPWLEVKR